MEEGKKRKVVLEGRCSRGAFLVGDVDMHAVIEVLKRVSEQDRERCMKGLGLSSAASECSEFADKVDINARFVPPTQEDADKTPCG